MSERSKDLILLILDIQGVENRLREFELRYRLRSSSIVWLKRAKSNSDWNCSNG
jgi:hypothetical protein